MFDEVHSYCLFVGHNKSGASLLSGLLDAHPSVVLSDEVDALQYIQAGFTREQIYQLLLKGARAEARNGRVTARRLEPYSYAVSGQWQGRAVDPLVVGDSTTGTSTRRLGSDRGLLERIGRTMTGADVKLIQVIRNPFDPISVMMIRGRRSFANSIDHYFAACDTLVDIRRRVADGALFPVRYESFVGDPGAGLASVCRFLGVEAEPDYLAACASIIRPVPDRSRAMVGWTQPWIDTVEGRLAAYDFLDGYSYEN
jgi:hypothetical protein